MRSFFFNAEATTDLAAHPTGYDRAYDADDHAAFFEPFFIGSGVFAGGNADACKVTVRDGTTLGVAAGAVYARGRVAVFDGTETITVDRDCHVVARMNKSKDVRAFQLLAVQELIQEPLGDIYDVDLAAVTLTAVTGGYAAQVTDKRVFMAFSGQPPYYPPDSDALPYILWLYTLGLPMTAEQRAAVEGNPSLMEIYNKTGARPIPHTHGAGDINAGTLPVVRGGTGATSLAALASAMGMPKIATGSYVGTGTYGAANPCSLTFPFSPKLVSIVAASSGNRKCPIFSNVTQPVNMDSFDQNRLGDSRAAWNNALLINLLPTEFDPTSEMSCDGYGLGQYPWQPGGQYYGASRAKFSSRTLSWFYQITFRPTANDAWRYQDSASHQFNAKDRTYHWIAFG